MATGAAWRDRFYRIEGQRVPSVTTVLDIIAKLSAPMIEVWRTPK